MAVKRLLADADGGITTIERWEKKRQDIIARLYATVGQPPVARNTRAIEMIHEEKLLDYTRRKIHYTVGDGDVITAYLLIPHNLVAVAPGIVAMHQTVNCGKDEVAGIAGNRDFAYGDDLAKRGYVVLTPDYLTAGERIVPGQEHFDSTRFYEQYPQWSIVGKNVADSFAAVDVLLTLDFVDKDRIGAIGHSLGGHNSMFVTALDDRIKVGVSNCGMSVFTEEEERLEWTLEDGYIYIPKLRPYFLADQEPPFDIHEVAALIAPRPFLNISAYFDFAYGKQEFLAEAGVLLYQVYKLYEQTRNFAYLLHGNNHSFPHHARSLAYDWLDRYLKN